MGQHLQPILHVLWTLAMKFSVRVLKHVVPSHMHSHVLLPQAFIQSLQLLAEVPAKMVKMDGMSCGQTDSENTCFQKDLLPLNIKVKNANVVNKYCKRSISQVSRGLPENLVQHCAVCF